MTSPLVPAHAPPEVDLASVMAQIQELAGRAVALTSGVEQQSDGDALLRLVTGRAGPADELLVGCPLPGSRVVAVLSSAPAAQDRLLRVSLGAARCVLSPTESVHLVRPGPARAPAAGPTERFASQVLRVDTGARIGISDGVDLPEQLPAASRAAQDAAALATADAPVVDAAARWAEITLSRLRGHVARLAVSPLGPLLDYDRRHGSSLATSLAVWLRHGRDVRTAAAELHVHPNTLRYRVTRAQELAGVDVDDPAQLLVLSLLVA